MVDVGELIDGKLPPEIWLLGGRWYSGASNDPAPPDSVWHVEVTAARTATIAFKTEGKSGATYGQYFRRV